MKLDEIVHDQKTNESFAQAATHTYRGWRLKKSKDLTDLMNRVSDAPEPIKGKAKTLLDAIKKSIATKDFQQASILKQYLEKQLAKDKETS